MQNMKMSKNEYTHSFNIRSLKISTKIYVKQVAV